MTRTILPIRFVLILATVIGIHGQDIPREATMTIMSNFEDGQSDREFKVDFAGVKDSSSATIKIFKKGDADPTMEYNMEKGAEKAQILYFKLKEAAAPKGSYQVQVCTSPEKCSRKRDAVGKVLDEDDKPTLSCIKGMGKEDNVLQRFEDGKETSFEVKIIPGSSFLESKDQAELPKQVQDLSAYKTFQLDSNPAYIKFDNKNVFYAAIFYDGKHLRELLDTAVKDSEKKHIEKTYGIERKSFSEEHTHAYCSRKYIFWASAHVMNEDKNVVLRRFRGTILPNELIVNRYILNPAATDIPVEFVREDEEKDGLPAGIYDVAVSFCATDKDVVNSSVCSKAIYSKLTVKGE